VCGVATIKMPKVRADVAFTKSGWYQRQRFTLISVILDEYPSIKKDVSDLIPLIEDSERQYLDLLAKYPKRPIGFYFIDGVAVINGIPVEEFGQSNSKLRVAAGSLCKKIGLPENWAGKLCEIATTGTIEELGEDFFGDWGFLNDFIKSNYVEDISRYEPSEESQEQFYKRALDVLKAHVDEIEAIYESQSIPRIEDNRPATLHVNYWLAWYLVEGLSWRKIADRTAERGWREYIAHTSVKEQVENLANRLGVRLRVTAQT
jgi:hypothetical protein